MTSIAASKQNTVSWEPNHLRRKSILRRGNHIIKTKNRFSKKKWHEKLEDPENHFTSRSAT